jgi:two-component system sensor histidine kinase KdpD
MTENRQNPDELLAKIQREEDRASRGRLKIFFGASAGVGKTYAMLSAAHELRAELVDVVVGIAETHGRKDTAALLEGLELIPRHAAFDKLLQSRYLRETLQKEWRWRS